MKTVGLFLAAALAGSVTATPLWWKKGGKPVPSPFYFTSTYQVVATPDQVINGTTPTPGEPGAIGYFNYGININLDVICYVSLPSLSLSSANIPRTSP